MAAAGHLPNPIPAKSVYLPLENPVVVIGPYFLAQYPIELTVMLDKDATVTDFNGTVIFRMKSKSLSLNNSRKLMDASGNVLASMSQKARTYLFTIFFRNSFSLISYLWLVCVDFIDSL
ncbi:hypothetical protein LINPERPRIM_LOCUS16227 [Linum perenne]